MMNEYFMQGFEKVAVLDPAKLHRAMAKKMLAHGSLENLNKVAPRGYSKISKEKYEDIKLMAQGKPLKDKKLHRDFLGLNKAINREVKKNPKEANTVARAMMHEIPRAKGLQKAVSSDPRKEQAKQILDRAFKKNPDQMHGVLKELKKQDPNKAKTISNAVGLKKIAPKGNKSSNEPKSNLGRNLAIGGGALAGGAVAGGLYKKYNGKKK